MSPTTFWLGRATAVLVALTLALGGALLFGSRESSGQHAVRTYLGSIDSKLKLLRSSAQGSHVVGAQIAVAVIALVSAILLGQWPVLLFVPAVAFGPKVLLDRRVASRVSQIEAQIEPWLVAIANALKASSSLSDAIASTTPLIPAPMRDEVDLLIKEYELGTPLDQALDNLAGRLQSRTLSGSVLALKVARRSGGNLSEMLENAAAALRELARLEGVVRTKTAEGKAQAFVISAIPAPMLLGIRAIDRHFFDPLFGTFLGNLILAGAAALWAVAILAARKIVAVDV